MKEFILERCSRELLKCVTPFFSHKTICGRILRTRGTWRGLQEHLVKSDWSRAVSVFDDFDSSADVLALGDSHITYAFAPAELKTIKGWNAGFNSGDVRIAYFVYMTLRKRWKRAPKQLVLINDEAYFISHQQEFTKDFYQSIFLHRLIDLPYRKNWFMRRHEHRLERIIKDCVPANPLARGFIAKDPHDTPTNSPEFIHWRAQGHMKRARFEPTERIWLDKLYAQIKADGRTLVLVKTPLRPDYLAEFDQHHYEPQSIMSDIKEIVTLDCRRWQFPMSDWYDSDHFLENGAKTFTQRLEHELLKNIKY